MAYSKLLIMAVMAMALMGCGSLSHQVSRSYMITVSREKAGGKSLVVMRPGKDAKVRFVSHKQRNFGSAPSIDDTSIVLNVAAAFTLDTETMDVCGDHVVAGERIAGYDDITATGHMLIVNNKVTIKGNDCLDESLKAAEEGKGYLFQQCYIVEDGKGMVERIPKAIRDREAHIIYRTACVTDNGNFVVIQGGEEMYCNEFIDALVAFGVSQALYLDMGTWAWGWVRENGKPTELAQHFYNTRYQSNWLQVVF